MVKESLRKGPVSRLKEAYLELLSDFKNYSLRKERENQELASLSSLPLLKRLVPILDDVEKALREIEAEKNKKEIGDKNQELSKLWSLLEGTRLIYEQLKKALKDYGLEEFSLLGKEFDPKLADACGTTAQEDGKSTTQDSPEGEEKPLIVVEELAKGYSFRGKLIRPARVIVSRGEKD